MAQLNLPPGVNAATLAAALQYLQSQAALQVPRPSGLLTPNQIRGVNPNYKYEFREYPKALTPPDVEIANANEERRMRIKWKESLPWSNNDPQGREYIEMYYAEQKYPKRVTPPQIIVEDATEEAAVRASWRAEFGEDAGVMFPAWLFHISKPAVLVQTAKQREALGAGWYLTAQEAMDAAKGQRPMVQASEEIERASLFERAEALGVSTDMRMKTPKLRQLVEDAEAKLEKGKAA